MAKRAVGVTAESPPDESEVKRQKSNAQKSRARWLTAFEKLEDKADAQEELDWVRVHPKMAEASMMTEPPELMPRDIKTAPSKGAVIMLQHWINNPAKFHQMILDGQKKALAGSNDDDEEDDDMYPEIKDIKELLMSLEGAVNPDGVVEITTGGLHDD